MSVEENNWMVQWMVMELSDCVYPLILAILSCWISGRVVLSWFFWSNDETRIAFIALLWRCKVKKTVYFCLPFNCLLFFCERYTIRLRYLFVIKIGIIVMEFHRGLMITILNHKHNWIGFDCIYYLNVL